MAWCENENCRKDGLRKADIEFCERTRKVLCHGCYALVHPGWIPPHEYVDVSDVVPKVEVMKYPEPRLGFAIQISDEGGFKAQVSFGESQFTFHSPTEDIKRLFGLG